jgi:REP element-mobilizing transposase RayT
MEVMSVKRIAYTIKLQVVFALAQDVAPLSMDEVAMVEEAFRSGARTFKCDILSVLAGERWFQLILATAPAFDVPKAITSLKAVTSRAMHARRGGDAGFWSLGYFVVSIGEPVDPEETAAKLENNGIKK